MKSSLSSCKNCQRCLGSAFYMDKSLFLNSLPLVGEVSLSDAIGKCAPTFCTVSSWQSTGSWPWEPGTSTRSLCLFHLQHSSKKPGTFTRSLSLSNHQKTTNNIFPLFDDDKQWFTDLLQLCSPFLYSPFLYIPPHCIFPLSVYLATHSFTSPFWHH